jgi:hypothetical protein
MKNSRRRLAAGWVVLCVGFSCGGDGGSGTIPIGELKAKSLDAVCGFETRCGFFPDKSTCESSVFSMLQLFADVSSGKVIYDGGQAAKCVDLYNSLGCNASDSTMAAANQALSCSAAFIGTVANGAPCFVGEECVSNVCNTSSCTSDMCCLGVCEPAVPVGGDCSSNGSECVPGAFCKFSAPGGATPVCATRVANGQPCTAFDQCVPGLHCNGSDAATPGVCGPLPREGAACPDNVCDASADVCDMTSHTCVRLIAVGGTCSLAGSACVSYARCDPTILKCVALASPGGACTTETDCIGHLPCVGGACMSPADVPACP